MGLLPGYIAAFLAFTILDALWLYTMGPRLYIPVLGDILAPEVRIAPAVAFYLLFPLGLTIFAVEPSVRSGQISTAIAYGALFGVFTYATYDLTNFATLRNWTLQITLIDIAYGAAVAALAAAAGHWAAMYAAR